MPVPTNARDPGSQGKAARSAKHRLDEALSTFTSAPARSRPSPTIATLCRLAGVSRKTLYRSYPDIAETVRRLRHSRGKRRQLAQEKALKALRSEAAALRGELAQLAALADHYYAAAKEQRALVAGRDRELAALRDRTPSAPTRIHRERAPGAPQ